MELKKYHISKPYSWNNLDDFKNFSNDILLNQINNSIYKKRWIHLVLFYTFLIFHIILTIVWVAMLQTTIDKSTHKQLVIWIPVAIALSSLFIVWFWYGSGLQNEGSVYSNSKAPLQWKDYLYSYRLASLRWLPKIRQWCPIGLFRISLVQLLALLNKIEEKDLKYLFDFSIKTNEYTAKFNIEDQIIEMENICKRNKLKYSQLNLILGLFYTLKFTDFTKTFIVSELNSNMINKKSSHFWWITWLKPGLTGYLWVFISLALLLVGIFA